jgi:hypothetical protein
VEETKNGNDGEEVVKRQLLPARLKEEKTEDWRSRHRRTKKGLGH